MSATANKEQLNSPTQGNLGLLEARRLTNKEDKLKDGLSLSKAMSPPTLEEDWVRSNLAAFHAKMSFTHCIPAARSHPPVMRM